MSGRYRLAAIGVAAVTLAACGGSGAQPATLEDIPTAFMEVQHLLGVINRKMDRVPDPSGSDASFEVPENLQSRFAKDGLFDARVRAWGWGLVRAQENLNRKRAPIYASLLADLEKMRDSLNDVREEDAVSNEFARLMKSYGRAVFEWVSAEGRVHGEVGDDMITVRRALRAHEQFLEDARAGAFPTDDDAETAYSDRIAPIMREVRDAQARSLIVRADTEDAVDNLNETRRPLGAYLIENDEAQQLVALIAESDPEGLFGYYAEKGSQ